MDTVAIAGAVTFYHASGIRYTAVCRKVVPHPQRPGSPRLPACFRRDRPGRGGNGLCLVTRAPKRDNTHSTSGFTQSFCQAGSGRSASHQLIDPVAFGFPYRRTRLQRSPGGESINRGPRNAGQRSLDGKWVEQHCQPGLCNGSCGRRRRGRGARPAV